MIFTENFKQTVHNLMRNTSQYERTISEQHPYHTQLWNEEVDNFVDASISDIITILNQIGIRTTFSCERGIDENLYISVIDNDINLLENIMKKSKIEYTIDDKCVRFNYTERLNFLKYLIMIEDK